MTFQMPWNRNKPSDKLMASIDDIKRQIGVQVDKLSKLTSDVGRDISAQAAQVSQDTGAQVGSAARDLGNQAARASEEARAQAASAAREVPVVAGALAQQALRGAAQLGRDLRQLRITKEPVVRQQRGPDLAPGLALLAGVGSGLAIMYFFDPNDGRRRRSLLRAQISKWTRIGRESAEGKAKDLRNRAVGVMYEARKAVAKPDVDQATDAMPAARAGGNGSSTGYERSEQPVTSEIV
jgi:hypothetical protein